MIYFSLFKEIDFTSDVVSAKSDLCEVYISPLILSNNKRTTFELQLENVF